MVGRSDPVSFICSCAAQSTGDGVILLFYRYFAAPPKLAADQVIDLDELAGFHRTLCERLHLRGKIRVALEGYNITVGGTKSEIERYVKECLQHWSFADLNLNTQVKQDEFFKPTSGGCACAFDNLNIRITSEITPLGITNYTPKDWDIVQSLTPADFHDKCWSNDQKILIDVRNHYESRIGYFVDPLSGEHAIMPEVRRFSQFPQYVKSHLPELQGVQEPRDILTYCTGGIRCEKSVRWMAERMSPGNRGMVYTLKGGIAAYLTWMDEEIAAGRKTPADSLFRGKNYVFDGRGSTGLACDPNAEPVSACHVCKSPSDRLSKCRSSNCHLILVVCKDCDSRDDPRCCTNCKELNSELPQPTKRPICLCEQEREARLKGVTR